MTIIFQTEPEPLALTNSASVPTCSGIGKKPSDNYFMVNSLFRRAGRRRGLPAMIS
ncbi:hypothetical protein [Sphingomonas sp. So64.6b]|uniref:hypothetical protein n=1 Tax=Sphingomonas sp. So64.6b TaxID=2997354 RepID=UPI001AEE9259|nr:hypothetical protein [Sphingomonas sp. So64.6b]